MPQNTPLRPHRPGRVPASVFGALALLLVAGLGVWYFTKSSAPKEIPTGRLISVEPIKGHEANLTQAEVELLRTGPNVKAKESLKRWLIATAKLKGDPLTRQQYLQEAIIMTEGYGQTPPIAVDTPQVRAAAAALKSGKNPERLNPLIAPAPFNPVAFKSDPQAYLDIPEPGRVFQMAPAAPGTPVIQPVSPYFNDVKQGGTVALTVTAAPGYPVSFTSFDDGAFAESGLTTITVLADSAGVATVHFQGVSGTVLESNILVSSPMASGQVRFKTNTLVYADDAQIASK